MADQQHPDDDAYNAHDRGKAAVLGVARERREKVRCTFCRHLLITQRGVTHWLRGTRRV
jgi:hypothetical protein